MADPTTELPGSTIPPAPPGKHHHWLMYAVIAVVVILAGIIVGTAAAHHGTTPTASQPSTTQPSQPQQSAPAAPATPPAYHLSLGQSVTITADVGDFWDVTVSSVTPYTQSRYDPAPPAGSHWVDVNVTYTAGSGSASVDEMDWKLKLQNGQTIDPTIMGQSNTQLQATTIPAPSKETGDVYLAVPDGATGVTVVYSQGLTEKASWDISS